MKTLATLIGAAAIALSASPVPQGQDQKIQGKKLVLEPGTHAVTDLISKSAVALGRNYLFSKQEIASSPQQDVEIQNRLELDERGIEEVVSQMLYSRGRVMTPVDISRNIYEWIAMNGPKRSDIQARALRLAPEEVLSRSALKIWASTVVALKHLDANVAVNSLRPFFATNQSGSGLIVGSVGGSRSLLLSGFSDQVANAIRLLQDADQPQAEVQVGLTQRLTELEQRVKALEGGVKQAK